MNNIEEFQSKFGRMIVQNSRQSALTRYYRILGHPGQLKRFLGESADKLSDEMKEAIRKILIECIDASTSDLLDAFDNYEEYMEDLKITVRGGPKGLDTDLNFLSE